MPSILITGTTGQLGQWLRQTVPSGTNVIVPTRHALDLSQPEAINRKLKAINPDAVINCAAYTNVDGAESDDTGAFRVNAESPAEIAAYTSENDIPLMHISTDFVFDGAKPTSYTPNDTPNPLNVYGASKLAGEQAVSKANPSATIVRTSWVYSEYGNNFVLKILELAATRPTLSIVTDQCGTPCYAKNLADALWLLLDTPHSPQTFHFADKGQTNRLEFAEAIVEEALSIGLLETAPVITGCLSKDFPAPALRPVNSALDAAEMESILNIKTIPWRTALRSMLVSYAAMRSTE